MGTFNFYRDQKQNKTNLFISSVFFLLKNVIHWIDVTELQHQCLPELSQCLSRITCVIDTSSQFLFAICFYINISKEKWFVTSISC